MSEEELTLAFEGRKPALTALGAWVKHCVLEALEKQLGSKTAVDKFLQMSPSPRVKELDSFLEKALVRKPKADPLTEITDQVGVRFVVLLLEDIDRIGKIVQGCGWVCQKDRDHDKERLEKPDYFAYQSDHYVIRTKNDVTFDGTVIPKDTPCEIQIRTILQHAYAEMAHRSDYKPTVHLPDEERKHVKRALAKGSALIETTDDVFREIRKRLHEYDASIQALLLRSASLYEELTGEKGSADTALGHRLTDTYREQLKVLRPDDLTTWAKNKVGFGDMLKEHRTDSVFYRDPVVVLLGLLIQKHETLVPGIWPFGSHHLQDYYTALGKSTDSLF